jgi:hypothetical protein
MKPPMAGGHRNSWQMDHGSTIRMRYAGTGISLMGRLETRYEFRHESQIREAHDECRF